MVFQLMKKKMKQAQLYYIKMSLKCDLLFNQFFNSSKITNSDPDFAVYFLFNHLWDGGKKITFFL